MKFGWKHRAAATAGALTLGGGVLVMTTAPPSFAATTTTFTYTGAAQTYTIPAGVTQLQVVVRGAGGGGNQPGKGGAVTSTISTPAGLGSTIQVMVGGAGSTQTSGSVSATAGWNGGGAAGSLMLSGTPVGGGGGASDLRQGTCAATSSCALSARSVVAGGGGAGTNYGGGDGGNPGGNASPLTCCMTYGQAGAGATQGAGGAGGAASTTVPSPGTAQTGFAGSSGQGGAGGTCSGCAGPAQRTSGGGGGGGYYGGGGGGAGVSDSGGGNSFGAGGGGGSSWIDPARQDGATTYITGTTTGNGSIEITPVMPPAPTVNNPTASAPNTASLSWTAPAGGADSYRVYQSTTSGGTYTAVAAGTCATPPTGTSCTVTGLTAGTTYYYKVSSVKSGVEGDQSPATSGVTAIDVPATPATPTATASADTALSVAWDTSAVTAARPVATYTVEMAAGSGAFAAVSSGPCAAPTASPCVVSGLTAGTMYKFRITAHNGVGDSAASAESTPVAAVAAPGAPTIGTVSVTGPGAVSVAFTAPSGTVDSYRVTQATTSGGSYTAVAAGTCSSAPTASPCTVTGLTAGTDYFFKVAAVRSGIAGTASAASSGTTAVNAPAKQATPTLAVSGDRALRVSWTPVTSTAAPADRYVVEMAAGSGAFAEVATGPCHLATASPCVVSGLAAGTAYKVRVSGRNAAGTGTASDESATVAAVQAPDKPVITTAAPGAGQVVVTWTPGAANGTTVTGFTASSETGQTCTSANATTYTCTVTGLTDGTQYSFTVVANAAVDSAPSTSVAATPSTAPGAPTVTATAGTSQIDVSWTAGTAGSGIAGYTVTASPGEASCEVGPTATGCVLGGTAGTAYTVSVVAKGAYGRNSTPATSSSVTPTAPPVPATPPTANAELSTSGGKISSVRPGQQVTVVGTGFAPHSSVTVTVYSDPKVLGSAVADAAGNITLPVTVPADLDPGAHRLVAIGVDGNGNSYALALAVSVPGGGGSGGLPVTGAAVLLLVVAGLSMLTTGAGLRLIGRGRLAA